MTQGSGKMEYVTRDSISIKRIQKTWYNTCAVVTPVPWQKSYHSLTQCKTALTPMLTLRLRQNGRHFRDDIFKSIFFNENVWIAIKISLKFVPMCSINNILALVQIMAWSQPGDKPSSEPMMVSLLMHICTTLPQWVNTLKPGQNATMWHNFFYSFL